jgi:DNA-binding transcriptional ArsR family regulator
VVNVPMTPELLDLLAERFRALGEPARLQILNAMRGGEKSVGELIESTGLSQANVSKHLQMLHATGFAARRKEGLRVYYRLADPGVFGICDGMCGRVEDEARARHTLLSAR